MTISNQLLILPSHLPRPLSSMGQAKGLLDLETKAILALLDCGGLMFGFDLRAPGARRPCFRIHTACLLAYLCRQPQPQNLEETIRDILPKPALPSLRSASLTRCLNVTSSHVQHLVHCGLFEVLRVSARGCGNCALLSRGSVEQFLRKRHCF